MTINPTRAAARAALALASIGLAISSGSLAPSAQVTSAPQQASPTKGLVKKGKVPVSTALPMIKLPKAAEAVLPNGLHLLVLEDHRLPQISFTIYIPGAGGYYDPADQPGLATFTAGLMREGTATRTSEQISQELEVMAATLNVGATVAGPEATVGGSCLTEQFEKLLDLASDVLLHPTFPEEELARYKQRLRTQLVQQRTIPGFLAQELFQRAVYGTHPASRVSTTIAALDAVTREAIVENHRAHFVPDHAAFAISGDISLAEAQKLVAAKFGGWSKSGANPAAPIDPAPIGAAKNLPHRPAQFGPDELRRRRAGDRAHERRLRPPSGDEPNPRRRADRTALHTSARGKGLHVWRLAARWTHRRTGASGPRARTCALR